MTHEPSSDAVSPTPHADGDTYHLAVQRDFVAQHFLF